MNKLKLTWLYFTDYKLYCKIKALMFIRKNFLEQPERHHQQLFVESCKLLGMKQNNNTKVLIYHLCLDENPNFKYYATYLPNLRINFFS